MSAPDLARARAISDYLDDFAAGFEAGPLGSAAFREAVHDSQERRKAGGAPEPKTPGASQGGKP